MKKVRILIVDDSAVIRQILSKYLSEDPLIEIQGVAGDGRIALRKIAENRPDLVLLDVEMPELDGLQTLKEIRKIADRLPVIMFSNHTARGSETTIEALCIGADAYVLKPTHLSNPEQVRSFIHGEIVSKIKQLCKVALDLPRPAPARAANCGDKPLSERRRIDVIALGISTGGPNALSQMLPELDPDFPVPILAVQHLPATFTRFLERQLSSVSRIKVQSAKPGEIPVPGVLYLANGDTHLQVERRGTNIILTESQGPPENSCRPSVDVLFRSVAKVYEDGCLALVMTGMGQDGLLGCRDIHGAGGQILVQDEKTSVVWGMPGYVANEGLAEKVLPLDKIAEEITLRAWHHRKK